MNSEIWEIIDENGRGTGKFCKRCERETIPDGFFHAVVEVWVRVGERLFLTQRHPDKWAGLMWEASGGAALAGETLTESAVRELEEETGISVSEDSLIYLGKCARGKSLIFSYLTLLDELPRISLQDTEVVDSVLADRETIASMWESLTEGTRERYILYKEHFI